MMMKGSEPGEGSRGMGFYELWLFYVFNTSSWSVFYCLDFSFLNCSLSLGGADVFLLTFRGS